MPPTIDGVTLKVGATAVAAAYFRGVNVANSPRFYYIPSHGQSLSIGDQGTPVVHTSETFGDTVSLFNGVPPIGSGFEVVPTEAEFTSLVNYKESSKETHGWAMFNWMSAAGVLTDRWLYGSYGVGGKTIAQLTDNPDPAGWGWNKVALGNAAAQARTPEGHQFTVPFATWIHGEADSAGDQAEYKTKLRAYHDRLMLDTGKTFPMLIDQTGKLGSSVVGTTLLEYAIDNADCRMVLPKYWLNRLYFGDAARLHLSNVGYQLQGEYFGRAAAKLLQGEDYQAVYPQSWSVDPTYKKLTVNFHVPAGGNLVVDTTTLPAAPGLGMGLNRPTYALDAATSYVQSGNSIEFTFPEVVTTDSTIILGATLSDGANNGGIILPCINLRDDSNDDSLAVPGVKLRNWCCQRRWSVTGAQGALNRYSDNLWLHGDWIGAQSANAVIGKTTDWLLKGMAQCTMECDVSITSGNATFWLGNNSKALTNGHNTLTGNITSVYRLYILAGSGGFSGSITNINVRFVS